MVADIVKKWRRWTHMNSTAEGTMQRKSQRRKEMENSHSPSQMEQSKSMWRTASENIHLNPGSSGTRRRTRNPSRKIR